MNIEEAELTGVSGKAEERGPEGNKGQNKTEFVVYSGWDWTFDRSFPEADQPTPKQSDA